jgi:cytosine/adenosine deaminase-related metal-dependent hydrolase
MASKLFRNGTILSFDDATQSIKVLQNASLLVVDGKIAALGDNVNAPADAETIETSGKIITPGFINTHNHAWQTAYRTLAPNTTLANYFLSYGQYSPASRSYTADDIYVSCLEGYIEGLHGGVTSYVEHAHSCWDINVVKSAYEGAVDSGARVYWCCAIEDSQDCSSEDQVAYMRQLNEKGQDKLVSLGLAFDGMGGAEKKALERTKKVTK